MKFGIFVGHSRSGDEGAYSVAGISEWDFWFTVAHDVETRLKELGEDCKVYDYYEGKSYGAAMSWVARQSKKDGITVGVELHFNAASPSAHGYEYLYYKGSDKGLLLAECFSAKHHEHYPEAKARGNNGVIPKTSGDRGAGFLQKTPFPAVISEPFFGTNDDEWEEYSQSTDNIADMIVEALLLYKKNAA